MFLGLPNTSDCLIYLFVRQCCIRVCVCTAIRLSWVINWWRRYPKHFQWELGPYIYFWGGLNLEPGLYLNLVESTNNCLEIIIIDEIFVTHTHTHSVLPLCLHIMRCMYNKLEHSAAVSAVRLLSILP